MTTIQILGTGCARCAKLVEHSELAARALGVEYRIEKVTDIAAILGFGVMSTPALVVNGVVKASGRVPTVDEIKRLLA